MYWITKPGDPNTTFIPMNTNNRFYYFLGRNVSASGISLGCRRHGITTRSNRASFTCPSQDYNTPVQPFPEGLRMVTGNPNAKAASTPPYTTFQCQRTASDLYVRTAPQGEVKSVTDLVLPVSMHPISTLKHLAILASRQNSNSPHGLSSLCPAPLQCLT